ncbi:pentapeptide repeat-containing protein [Rickettsiella massiliensis]|uniref:pentapeptide repeat-containing protein n=1 Tax=Rickettsiella massiliensis TaxID=676517 RepID=UPI000299DD9E|nr:pentapeptide repeat-containing protein [Rickettsiella massiliensis]
MAHAFLYANIETRIKEIPKHYIYDLSPLAVQEVNSLTHHLLRNLIDKEFSQFKSVDSLNRIDFSYANLAFVNFKDILKTQIKLDFSHANLEGVDLSKIKFFNTNLKKLTG